MLHRAEVGEEGGKYTQKNLLSSIAIIQETVSLSVSISRILDSLVLYGDGDSLLAYLYNFSVDSREGDIHIACCCKTQNYACEEEFLN